MPLLSVNLSIDRLIAQIEINGVSAKKPMHNRSMVATIVFLYVLFICTPTKESIPILATIIGKDHGTNRDPQAVDGGHPP